MKKQKGTLNYHESEIMDIGISARNNSTTKHISAIAKDTSIRGSHAILPSTNSII